MPGRERSPLDAASIERVKELEGLLDVVRLLAGPHDTLEHTLSAVVERLTLTFSQPASVRLDLHVTGGDDAARTLSAGPSPSGDATQLVLESMVGSTTLTLQAAYPAGSGAAFLPEEVRLLDAVVDVLAAHVERRRELERSLRLQRALEQREAVQRSLLALHERFLRGWSHDVADMILDAAIAAVPAATHGSVLVTDDGGCRFAALRGYAAEAVANVVIPPDWVLFGRDWRAGRAFIVDDPGAANDLVEAQYPEFEALVAVTRSVGAREALVAPVVVGDDLLAAISVEHTEQQRRFGDADGELLMLFAQSIGPLLQRSRAEDDAALLQQAINASSDGIAIVDVRDDGRQARVRTCNQVFADLLGVDPADTRSWRIRDALGDTVASHARDAITAVSGGAGSARFEANVPTLDGGDTWLEVLVTSVPRRSDTTSVLVSVRDVSERKGLVERLQRLNTDLEQRLAEARTLEAIDTAITHGADEAGILAGVMRVVRSRPDVLDANLLLSSAVGLQHAESTAAQHGAPLARRTLQDDVVASVPSGGTVLELAPDAPRHPYATLGEVPPYGPYLAWPLSVQGGVAGVLELVLHPNVTPDVGWRRFMHAVSTQVSVAVEHAALIGRLQHAAVSYAALARFNEAIEHTDDPMELIDLGARTLLEEFGMQRAVYVEVDDAELLRVVRRWGPIPEAARATLQAPQSAATGTIGLAIRSGEVVHVPDYPSWPHAVTEGVAAGMRSVLALPVRSDGAVRAALGLSAIDRTVALRPDQITVARAFARRLERALERLAYERQIVSTREDAFRALGVALEHRDYETKGHTDRVVALSRALGERVGLDPDALEALAWGAYLHDLGKIAIPDHILLKPGRLDAHEFEQVKRHAVVGYDMSRDLAFLPEATREVVRSHHEHWDGRGYPDGLAGDAIPYLARLFAVVDVYDALTSERPYKRAWTVDEALAELESQSGRQFDPRLCAALVALIRDQAPG